MKGYAGSKKDINGNSPR